MEKINFFRKKTISVPTTITILIFTFTTVLFSMIFFLNIHQFLAANHPINGQAIIIEGWLPDYCIEHTADYIKKNKYKHVFITGGPLEQGSYLKEYTTYAALGGATLRKLSVPDSQIFIIPALYSNIDRTYASAISLKKWLDSTNCSIQSFDICSQSTHTRRSTLLFKRALGKKFKIGSIVINNRDYNSKVWWKSSQGVRSVIDETIAYIYAWLFIFFRT